MKNSNETTTMTFRGFRSPNTTPIPDEVFDELLADLSGAELKVLLYICRRTFGWKKESDNISLNQMLRGITRKDGTRLDRGVGLSKPTLLRTIKSLVEKGIILAEQRDSQEKGHEPTNYRLHMADPLGQKLTLGVSQNFTKGLVKKSYPQ
jgi:phage replication O-like protein O